MIRRLIAYQRVSTSKQSASGLGLEGQDASVMAYAKATGAMVIRTFTEVETGKRADRPELDKALAACRRERATLVIAKLDRLSRNVAFLANLMDAGVDFVCCDNPNANRLTLHILAAVAEDEARRISERTKAALSAYKARGGMLGAARPGAHRLTGGANAKAARRAGEVAKSNADAAYADIASLVIGLRSDGLSYDEIADQLNDEGHITRRGCRWTKTQVWRVCRRYTLSGTNPR